MSKLKIGVIGLRMGHVHCKAIATCPKTQLVSVCDLAEERRQVVKGDFPRIQTYENYEDLIRKSDAEAVVIAVPVPLHYPVAMAALKAGKHIVCEKPPAVNAQETEKIVNLANQKKLVLTWGLQRRFLPHMHAARHAIAQGKLGQIYSVDAKYTHARIALILKDRFRMLKQGGGVFFDIGIHSVDMAWSLLGCPKPVRVVASNHTAFPAWNAVEKREDMAEDNSTAMFFFDNGSIVTVEVCYWSQRENPTGHTINLRLLGDKGGLQIPTLAYTTGKSDAAVTSTLEIKKSWQTNSHNQLYSNFADAVAGKGELLIKAEHGLNLMKMVDAVVKSAAEGREIRLK